MPPRKPSPVGAHVPCAGGLGRTALPYAKRVGAEAIQIFLGNPRGWAPAVVDPASDDAFRDACESARIPIFIHAPYLINLASPSETTLTRSAAALEHQLLRGAALGADGVVVHAGSAVEQGLRDVGLKQVREALLPVLERSEERAGDALPRLLIEPTAGGGAALASTVQDLEPYLAALDWHPRVGVCLDTCHAYAAGHDLAQPGGVRRMLNALVTAVGKDRLRLVHANDSRDPLGSGRDRHAPVGVGTIGIDPFGELFVHPATRGVSIVVETPGGEERHAADIRALKRLRDRPR